MICRNEDKLAGLVWLLREVIPVGQPTLIFVATRHHVELLHALLAQEELDAACVYGTMDQVCTCPPAHAILLRTALLASWTRRGVLAKHGLLMQVCASGSLSRDCLSAIGHHFALSRCSLPFPVREHLLEKQC